MSTNTRELSHEVVLALLRTGDARALLAAALIVVTLTLTVHTKARALDETGRAVLYVGAPSVSVSSAREAGVISRSYAETASLETLLALGFSGESAEGYVVDRALASVTEQPADPDEIITAQAALEAGAVYLAQTGARPLPEAGPGSGGELASAEPVRPELGDRTVAPVEDLPTEDSSTKDPATASDAGDPAEIGPVSSDGGDLAYASEPPDTPAAAYPGTFGDDSATLYPSDPASGEGGPLEFVSSSPTGTDAGEDFPEEDSPGESEIGPISAGEQVPTTLAGGQMEMPSSGYESANESAADGEEELAVVAEESPSEEDAADDAIRTTDPHSFPGQRSSTISSVEEPNEQNPAILLPAEPAADERLPAPAEVSTPHSGDGTSGEATVGVSISQKQTAEEGFEDDPREQVATLVVEGEQGHGRDVTVADGDVPDEIPRQSPEPARNGETPRPDTAEPTGTTEAPPVTTPEQEAPPAEAAPDEGALGESRPPDRQDDRTSPERPTSDSEADDPRATNPESDVPRGSSRDEPVTTPPDERRGDPGQVPAGPEDGPEDREPTHAGSEANGRAPRGDAGRHQRRPVDAAETRSRQPQVLSDRGTRRPGETPAEDGARRAARDGEAYREDAVEQARLERAHQERLAARRAAHERRAARQTTATFEPTNTESENREHGRRVPLATDDRGLDRAGDDGALDARDAPNREEDLD